MGKIIDPITISGHFNINEDIINELGIINVILNSDTLLFIDPLLLPFSRHLLISQNAFISYNDRFKQIIKLLSVTKEKNDVAWRAAKKLFNFSEVNWTCLGYGSANKGSGFGKDLTENTITTAHEIIQLGVTDVDLFMALALFEEGIGPDRISDMTTNIIIDELIIFTNKINDSLNIPSKKFHLRGKDFTAPVNPYADAPLLFVPTDIVRDLPVATDWSDISRVVKENEKLRERLNKSVGEIWAKMTKKDKDRVKRSALRNKESFDSLLSLVKDIALPPYDLEKDPNGELFWTRIAHTVASLYPVDLSRFQNNIKSRDDLKKAVYSILELFQDLVENKGLWKELWSEDDKPRKEKAAQRLFFAVAHSYCKANNLDLSPEADSGNGPVDFKISYGYECKILVEIKLSTNSSLVHGYEKQLEIYKKADDTELGIFLIIDVGSLGQRYARVQKLRDTQLEKGLPASKVFLIDGNQRASASKRV